MKKKRYYIYMLMLLCSITSTYGQDNPSELRRTTEEQAAYEKTKPLNPAKIAPETLVDPRMITAQVSPTNWKPVITPMDEKKNLELILVDKVSTDNVAAQPVIPAENRSQPKPQESREKVINYRDMQGPKTQPDAPKAGNVDNYRKITGSKSQPRGEKPKQ